MTSLIFPDEFSLDKLSFEDPVKDQTTLKSNIKYNGSPLFIQTLKMSYEVLSPNDIKLVVTKEKHATLLNVIGQIELSAVDNTTNMSEKWFNKKITKEQVTSMFVSVMNSGVFKTTEPIESRQNKIVCLIKVDSIVFEKKNCYLNISVVKHKFVDNIDEFFQEKKVSEEVSEEVIVNDVIVNDVNFFGSEGPKEVVSVVEQTVVEPKSQQTTQPVIEPVVEEISGTTIPSEPTQPEPEPTQTVPKPEIDDYVLKVKQNIKDALDNNDIDKAVKLGKILKQLKK